MKTTSAWLNEHFEKKRDALELSQILTMAGTEVEHMAPAAAPDEGQVLQLEVTSNRVDCLGVRGLVREIAAVTGESAKLLQPKKLEAPGEAFPCAIQPDAKDACPRYTARKIRGVKVAPSPKWLADRLEAIGVATINNIVDITNLVLHEFSQPLHAFDLAKLKGEIIVRKAKAGEVFAAINHRSYKLTSDDLVIADAAQVVALAGIMGGADSEITFATKDVLIESAYFEPFGVKATGRRMDKEHSENLDSDSRYRFERGVDPCGIEAASDRAIELILEIAGGTLEGPLSSVGELGEPWLRELTLRASAIGRTLGAPVASERVAQILSALGLQVVSSSASEVTVRIPSFRRDLEREIDLVEEIARTVGLAAFESRLVLPISRARPEVELEDRPLASEILRGLGHSEVVTDTFVADKGAATLTPWLSGPALRARAPINTHWPCLRRSLMPSLARIYGENIARSGREVALFEMSTLSLTSTKGEIKPATKTVVAIIGPDFYAVKGALEAFLTRFGIEGVSQKPSDFALFADGEGAVLSLGNTPLGYVGRLSSAASKEFSLVRPATVAELDFEMIVASRRRVPMMAAVPRFPASNRDLAVVVDDATTWAQIEASVRGVNPANLRDLVFFDEFRGKQVPKGKKSLAFAMTFRDDARTLVSEEVDHAMTAIIAALQSQYGAEVRS